jgi:hypothetical protein
MSNFKMGRLFGLQLSVTPLALVGTLILWLAVALLARWLLDLPLVQAVAMGFVGALLWWLSDVFHHLGHAYAARTTGYPMVGIEFGQFAVFCRSVYPPDEPELPAQVHIRRALGGPIASFVLGVVALLVALLLAQDSLGWWLAAYVAFVSLFVFGLGALLPLGFTDGSTLLAWWGKR